MTLYILLFTNTKFVNFSFCFYFQKLVLIRKLENVYKLLLYFELYYIHKKLKTKKYNIVSKQASRNKMLNEIKF